MVLYEIFDLGSQGVKEDEDIYDENAKQMSSSGVGDEDLNSLSSAGEEDMLEILPQGV